MDQPGIVPLLRPADHLNMIAAVAAFVAGGPYDDAGMILEGFHHPLHPVQEFMPPLRLGAGPGIGFHVIVVRHIGQAAQKTVGLDIRFTNDVQADFVAHLDKFRCGRIMGSADAIHIQFLHQKQVVSQFLIALAPSPGGAGIMVIDTVQLHRNTVDEERIVIGNIDPPQSGHPCDDLTAALQFNTVKEGLFRVPEDGVFGHEDKLPVEGCIRKQRLSFVNTDLRTAIQADVNRVIIGNLLHITDMTLRALQNVAIPENAVVAEEILIFQIAAAAPFQYLYQNGIGTVVYIICDIKFRLQVAALGKAHAAAVDIDPGAGRR